MIPSALRLRLLAIRVKLTVAPFAARHLLWYVNQARMKLGLVPLRQSLLLDGVAAWRAQDMATRGVMSHDIPGIAGQVFAVLSLLGYRCKSAGEIIGWTDAVGFDAQDTWLTSAWMASPEHHAIVVGRWDTFGAGTALTADGKTYCAVLFSVAT